MEAYHKIYTIVSIMPSSINLYYNKRNMQRIPFIFNIVREALFPINHKPNAKHILQAWQECQQY